MLIKKLHRFVNTCKKNLFRSYDGVLFRHNYIINIVACIIFCFVARRESIYHQPVLQNNFILYREDVMLADILYLFVLKPRLLDRYTQDGQRAIYFGLLFLALRKFV